MKQVPNLFTLLNLVFGCIAIIFILQTGESILLLGDGGFTEVNLPEKIVWGSICIFAAGLIDFLDGFVARLFKAGSEMGKQLDSLADLVSFGVAPGLILYQLLRISFAREPGGLEVAMGWLLPALLIPCAAAWRLARFNIDSGQEYSFKGLPAPSAGLVIASIPLMIWYPQFDIQQYFVSKWVLYGIILLFSYLMVSRLPLMGMKFKDYSLKNNMARYLLLIVGIVAAIWLKWLAIPVIFLAYVVLSLTLKNKSA